MSIAEIPDLGWSAVEAVVALAKITLPVLPFTVDDTENGKNEDADLTAKIDGMACRVLGGISCNVCPSSVLANMEIKLVQVCQLTK